MLVDSIGRNVTYLRLSVTDRCDLRCAYCMKEQMEFAPKSQILTLEELYQLTLIFVRLGVKKLRITGGEPLVRRNIISLFENLTGKVDELTLTTNGTLLNRYAASLYQCGVRRVNVSLDTLDGEFFTRLSRGGNIQNTLAGIEAAQKAGLKVKINMVALKQNKHQIQPMLNWCKANGFSLTLIEVMPLGDLWSDTGSDKDNLCTFHSLAEVQSELSQKYAFEPVGSSLPANGNNTSGPATYALVNGVKLGFITPHTNNFCAGCNRVRVDSQGRLYPCLGSDNYTDLKHPLRFEDSDAVIAQIAKALTAKPKGHEFTLTEGAIGGGVKRSMNVTGG